MTDRDSSHPTSSASSSVSVEAEEQKKSSRPQIILFTHITFTPRNMRPPSWIRPEHLEKDPGHLQCELALHRCIYSAVFLLLYH